MEIVSPSRKLDNKLRLKLLLQLSLKNRKEFISPAY